MTFIIFSHGIICIAHGNHFKAVSGKCTQMVVVYWEFSQCNAILTVKTKIFLTKFVLLTIGLSTCEMMLIRFLNQYIKLMSISDVI